jgi:heat shock protein HslJ
MPYRAAAEISGSAGCNTYGGSSKVSGDSLTLVGIYANEMGCLEPAGVLEQESTYLIALRSAASYRIDGSKLVILDKGGSEILVYTASP